MQVRNCPAVLPEAVPVFRVPSPLRPTIHTHAQTDTLASVTYAHSSLSTPDAVLLVAFRIRSAVQQW
ncbi:hypothetical protein ANCDUO_02638 [Ancylostoma duodenale]|uniref:Uncharacterized protein n=1 Tax=Ancylostoma duodenale TaxID=51022 RepID=A0A0C2DB89_9BILA|nr:hypothetical protein ANCDUO_02638 [Ancylostoma duodenale]